jgi:hypothetical protein
MIDSIQKNRLVRKYQISTWTGGGIGVTAITIISFVFITFGFGFGFASTTAFTSINYYHTRLLDHRLHRQYHAVLGLSPLRAAEI